MELEAFYPRPALVTKTTLVEKPRFPAIDAHNHLGDEFGGGWVHRPLAELLDMLDASDVRMYVDLDGGWGEAVLYEHLEHLSPASDRFCIFGGVDWSQWAERGDRFAEWAASRLRVQKGYGAAGLKVWKNFGLHVRDHRGELVTIDDPRLDPIWETAADLNWPVVIHVADPVAFFDPLDENNERWEELHAHPDWQFPSPPFPPFMTILNDLALLVVRHPKSTFIGAHVGCYAENLVWVGDLLERCPNFYVDIAARFGELGRQPYTARRFYLKYADRILFGSDFGPYPKAYRVMYRFLETDDEYFNYSPAPIPMQGGWYMHGLYLPDEVLEKVYFRNAERVILNNTTTTDENDEQQVRNGELSIVPL
jgi:predicted TIM-barrel fold metal-dependent hydrolase